MQCPKCELPLDWGEAEWHVGYTCKKCEGIWLPHQYLASLKYSCQFDVASFRKALANSQSEPKRKLVCPSCTVVLKQSKAGNVELDWCERCHGVWFDRSELTRIATYKLERTQTAANQHAVGLVVSLINRMLDAYFEKYPEQIPLYQADANGYVPNHIPGKERVSNLIFSVLLFAYGTFGVYINDLYIPGKRSKGVHLHNLAAWVMYGAMICACLVMFSVIVDHYDRRNNEEPYRKFANTAKFLGWVCFVLSLVLMIAEK